MFLFLSLHPISSLDVDPLMVPLADLVCFSRRRFYFHRDIYIWDLGFLFYYFSYEPVPALSLSYQTGHCTLVVGSSFVGGIAMEAVRFSLSTAHLLAR